MTNQNTAVAVEGLSVKFGQFTAVDNISFSVAPGEIFGFLGANGAGKTTTIRVLCGLLEPTSGKVFISGKNFHEVGERLKEEVGYMSQKFTLYEDMTVLENLTFTARLRLIPKSQFHERMQRLLSFVGFDRELNTMVRLLPGGVKQKVSLVASMLHEPSVLFLDEPTAGVTPAARAKFWDLIKELAKKGKTVFVTTHYMDEAEQCHRIALMRAGQIVALDSPERLKSSYFPHGLIDLNPKAHVSQDTIHKLKEMRIFSLFEPYGMRYHAEISDEAGWLKHQASLRETFEIASIVPSLEDVFIRAVEGAKR